MSDTLVRPIRRRQQDRTALSDERMTRAAIQLLVSRGVAGTTLAAIAEGAGYSRGLVTHRFGSKMGLFAHVVAFLSAEWRTRLNAAVSGHEGLDAIRRAIDALGSFMREAPDYLKVTYLLWYQSLDPGAEFHANVAAVHEAQRRDLAAWIRQGQLSGEIHAGIDPTRAATMLAASIAGLVFHWLVSPDLPVAELHRQLNNDVKHLLSVPRDRSFHSASREDT
jgi:AcrR family transcriptional regulator